MRAAGPPDIDVDAREWANGLTFSATYFNIDFRDRIENPAFGPDILDDPVFASLITRNPTAGELSTACNQGRYISGSDHAVPAIQCGQRSWIYASRTWNASAPTAWISTPATRARGRRASSN